jgi:fluoride exporter
MPDRRELIVVFAGGAVGTLIRVGLTRAGAPAAPSWPWMTFAVNVAGSAFLGYVAGRPWAGYRRPLLGTGFCGALTTFSTLQLELLTMVDSGLYVRALAYATASVAAGYAGLLLAHAAVRRARRPA